VKSKARTAAKPEAKPKKTYRNFPIHPLEDVLPVARAIRHESAGKPMNRNLLADALHLSPSSSNVRDLLSSSYKYGLTDGTEKAVEISLTDWGQDATSGDVSREAQAMRQAALKPSLFERFYRDFDQNKVPNTEMLRKLLVTKYEVPEVYADECAATLLANGRFVRVIKELTGGPRVMLDSAPEVVIVLDQVEKEEELGEEAVTEREFKPDEEQPAPNGHSTRKSPEPEAPRSKPIFVGHGKNTGPLEKVDKFLTKWNVNHKIAVEEPNKGRPIPTKVRDVMRECGSAILIFTKDVKFLDPETNEEIWRPSENVIYELGAASLLYDRVVIMAEKGLHFPTNFESVGRIEFEEDMIEAKTSDLLLELIAFGLVTIHPV
jgi:predicted nucleotide-binding protein